MPPFKLRSFLKLGECKRIASPCLRESMEIYHRSASAFSPSHFGNCPVFPRCSLPPRCSVLLSENASYVNQAEDRYPWTYSRVWLLPLTTASDSSTMGGKYVHTRYLLCHPFWYGAEISISNGIIVFFPIPLSPMVKLFPVGELVTTLSIGQTADNRAYVDSLKSQWQWGLVQGDHLAILAWNRICYVRLNPGPAGHARASRGI